MHGVAALVVSHPGVAYRAAALSGDDIIVAAPQVDRAKRGCIRVLQPGWRCSGLGQGVVSVTLEKLVIIVIGIPRHDLPLAVKKELVDLKIGLSIVVFMIEPRRDCPGLICQFDTAADHRLFSPIGGVDNRCGCGAGIGRSEHDRRGEIVGAAAKIHGHRTARFQLVGLVARSCKRGKRGCYEPSAASLPVGET